MTTQAAERLYLAQHLYEHDGKKYAIFNPNNWDEEVLPIIYGFNNGGKPGWYQAVLLAEDGEALGFHTCSHEGYMRYDLGVLEGSRPDRHEDFRKHYPDGYRMTFVSFDDVQKHEGLQLAVKRNTELRKQHNKETLKEIIRDEE